MIGKFVLFLAINFAALAIGGIFTGKGVTSEWYTGLQKAPWTPPGWVFGAAWTAIMICLAFFMTYAIKETHQMSFLIGLFAIQWVLNVLWNPVFFYFHQVLAGLIVIAGLTALIAFIFFYFWPVLKLKSLWILPYFIWLIIATSLNAYIYLNN